MKQTELLKYAIANGKADMSCSPEVVYGLIDDSLFVDTCSAQVLTYINHYIETNRLATNVVASFVKKISRAALTAPIEGVFWSLLFVYKTMKKNPSIEFMLDSHNSETSFSDDPFLKEEQNPTKSSAIDSSLWEIQTLGKHSVKMISSLANSLICDKTSQTLDKILESYSLEGFGTTNFYLRVLEYIEKDTHIENTQINLQKHPCLSEF